MLKLICIDEKNGISSTINKLHRNTNKSNLSQTDSFTEFRSTKVYMI